jgi:drug/metabolite transporter (DMT)-like permease
MDTINRFTGVILVAISAASFGTLAIFGRFAYADGIDTSTLLFMRFTLAAFLMAGLLLLRRESFPRGKTLWELIGMGAIGYVGQSFAYLSAIKYASAGLVALLLYLYPTFVAILSVLFLKGKLTGLKILALCIATLGTALTVDPQGGELKGILLALVAALVYAVYIIVGAGVMQKVSAFQSSTVIFASAGAVYAVMTAINGPRWPVTNAGWATTGAMAVIATVIPVAAFLAGLKRVGPTDASMLSTIEPVVTVLLAALIFDETLQLSSLLGGGLILGAVVLLTQNELRQARHPELAINTASTGPKVLDEIDSPDHRRIG